MTTGSAMRPRKAFGNPRSEACQDRPTVEHEIFDDLLLIAELELLIVLTAQRGHDRAAGQAGGLGVGVHAPLGRLTVVVDAGLGLAADVGRLAGAVALRVAAHGLNQTAEYAAVELERERLLRDTAKRVKELRCMYGVAESIRKREKLDAIFENVVALIPPGWQYPEITCDRVHFDDKEPQP